MSIEFERIGGFREDNRYRRLSNAVGRLDLLLADRSGKPQYTSICTASLIAEDLILTNYHCIPGVEPGLTVVQAQLRMGYLSAEIEGTPYDVVLPPVESQRALDYSIVRVKGTPGRAYGTVRLDLRDAKASEALVIIHHPQGYPKRLTRRDCFAAPSHTLTEADLAHHCDTLPGSSGAPVFSDDDFALVELHYAGYGGVPSSDTYNFAKRVASIQQASAQLQRLASATPAVVPAPAPTPQPVPSITVTPPPPRQPSTSGDPKVAVRVYQPPTELPKTLRNSIRMEFVLIPAGTFQMGSNDSDAYDDEKPVPTVRITQPFYLGQYEVTQGQWQAVMGNNPNRFTGDPNRPVENVSWDDVQDFIRRLNAREGGVTYRLPTEAEWEYAARAGTTSRWSFGDDASQLGRYAWHNGNAGGQTHPVGQLQPNPWSRHFWVCQSRQQFPHCAAAIGGKPWLLHSNALETVVAHACAGARHTEDRS